MKFYKDRRNNWVILVSPTSIALTVTVFSILVYILIKS